MMDRYAQLGKRIHVTELGFASKRREGDLGAFQVPTGGYWHTANTPELQAEWTAAFYALATSKPYCDAITYWDYSDHCPFIANAGLVDARGKPKPGVARAEAVYRGSEGTGEVTGSS